MPAGTILQRREKYNFNSLVQYVGEQDETFDPRHDIIISFLRTNEDSVNNTALVLEGGTADGSTLELQSEAGDLGLNLSNSFDNLTIFLTDSRVSTLTGVSEVVSRTTAVSAFDIAPVPGITWLSAGVTVNLEPSASNVEQPEFNIPEQYLGMPSGPFGTAGNFFLGNEDLTLGVVGDTGWNLGSPTVAEGTLSPFPVTLFSYATACSGLFPWEIETWNVNTPALTSFTDGSIRGSSIQLSAVNDSYDSVNQTVRLSFSGFKSIASNHTPYIGLTPVSVDDPYQLQSPGANLVAPRWSKKATYLNNTRGFSLSGLMLMACIDNNGSFSLSSSIPGTFTGGLQSLSAGVFSVRANADTVTSTESNYTQLSTFDFKGAYKTDYNVVDNDWKLHRIGFRNHLQEVVLYGKTDGVYEVEKVFETGFQLERLPPGVKIGFSYSGRMPMEIQNIAINGSILD